MKSRHFRNFVDSRLVVRGNKILGSLFRKSIHSIRQLTSSDSEAKAFYRFLKNERVTEQDIVDNLQANCVESCRGKYVVCIQDTTEINLNKHRHRIKHDSNIGTTNQQGEYGLGFFLHPCLVLDANIGTPYGYADIKVWNRPLELTTKHERKYTTLPIQEKESYKWIEVSKNTQACLNEVVEGMIIIQDREGDIYEQFATIPNAKTDLIIRARTNRVLADETKLFSSLDKQKAQGSYDILVDACTQTKRQKRCAKLEVRYKEVELKKTRGTSKEVAKTIKLYLIEAKEVNYKGKDPICWRILTTIEVDSLTTALNCIEWYSWRWTIEEVFKILKKEGFNIEASELESAGAIRKMSLIIMEVVIKLFLLRMAYNEPEVEIAPETCFTKEEQKCLEKQITVLEGKTEKQKNPYSTTDLKRYSWVIARLGGWKGYATERKPGITTFWNGLKQFKAIMEGWQLHKFVSTR
jgi:hypothetical protein